MRPRFSKMASVTTLFFCGIAMNTAITSETQAAIVTPPSSVPNTYTASGPVATSTVGLTLGLSETNYGITPTQYLYYGGSYLEGSNTTDLGYPTLQGMANLEMLAINGSITVSPSPAGGSGNYSATVTGSATDTGINTNSGIHTGIPNDAIRDEIGYVYVSQAGQTYDFNLNNNDDGTEVFLGGNGTTASGTVVVAQNADNSLGANVSTNTAVTFSSAGLYRFEIFNAQTWGSSDFNFTYAADSSTPGAPPLVFYSGSVPEPAPMVILGIGAVGLMLLRRRRVASVGV